MGVVVTLAVGQRVAMTLGRLELAPVRVITTRWRRTASDVRRSSVAAHRVPHQEPLPRQDVPRSNRQRLTKVTLGEPSMHHRPATSLTLTRCLASVLLWFSSSVSCSPLSSLVHTGAVYYRSIDSYQPPPMVLFPLAGTSPRVGRKSVVARLRSARRSIRRPMSSVSSEPTDDDDGSDDESLMGMDEETAAFFEKLRCVLKGLFR